MAKWHPEIHQEAMMSEAPEQTQPTEQTQQTGQTPQTDATVQGSPEKDPSDWVTGDEPMTGPQKSYLDTLARQAGQDAPDDLTKAEASSKIDELQQQTGRGAS